MQRPIGFVGILDPSALPDPAVVHVVTMIRGKAVRMTTLENSRFLPVCSWLNGSSCILAGRRITMKKDALILDTATGSAQRRKDELQLLKVLLKGKSEGMRKAFAVRMAAHIMKPFTRKKIWLFSDRVMRAGDNGEAMFRYVSQNCPRGVKPVFLLHSKSADFARLKRIGKVVRTDSQWAKLYYLLASVSVSSSGDQ